LPCCHALTALYASKIGLHDGFDLIPSWFEPLEVLGAYDYLVQGRNEEGEEVMIHTGLQAIDINCLHVYIASPIDPDFEDPFADIELEPPPIPKKRGKQTKRREAGDGKGPLYKPQKPQVCSVCGVAKHNKKKCKNLLRLEGDSAGLGVL
jgi:hypothetical protein